MRPRYNSTRVKPPEFPCALPWQRLQNQRTSFYSLVGAGDGRAYAIKRCVLRRRYDTCRCLSCLSAGTRFEQAPFAMAVLAVAGCTTASIVLLSA